MSDDKYRRFDALINRHGEAWFALQRQLESDLAKLSGEDLRDLYSYATEDVREGYVVAPHLQMIADAAQFEPARRRCARRTAALGTANFCYLHDCAREDCEPGAHE